IDGDDTLQAVFRVERDEGNGAPVIAARNEPVVRSEQAERLDVVLVLVRPEPRCHTVRRVAAGGVPSRVLRLIFRDMPGFEPHGRLAAENRMGGDLAGGEDARVAGAAA